MSKKKHKLVASEAITYQRYGGWVWSMGVDNKHATGIPLFSINPVTTEEEAYGQMIQVARNHDIHIPKKLRRTEFE